MDRIPNPALRLPLRVETYFDNELVGAEGMGPHIERAYRSGPIPQVFLWGDRDAKVEDIYAAIDQVKGVDQKIAVVIVTPAMEQWRRCAVFHPVK